jgi:hypothetical protein
MCATVGCMTLTCALHCCRYTDKFSVNPPLENVDVNMTVAWWGSAQGNAV